MVLYGEEEEEMMASSPEGSVIRRIWDEKIVKQYYILYSAYYILTLD